MRLSALQRLPRCGARATTNDVYSSESNSALRRLEDPVEVSWVHAARVACGCGVQGLSVRFSRPPPACNPRSQTSQPFENDEYSMSGPCCNHNRVRTLAQGWHVPVIVLGREAQFRHHLVDVLVHRVHV